MLLLFDGTFKFHDGVRITFKRVPHVEHIVLQLNASRTALYIDDIIDSLVDDLTVKDYDKLVEYSSVRTGNLINKINALLDYIIIKTAGWGTNAICFNKNYRRITETSKLLRVDNEKLGKAA